MGKKILLAILMKKIETLLEAATYAEAGAFEIARETLKKEGHKTDKEVFMYAENLRKRLGAELEVLYVIRPDDEQLLEKKQLRSRLIPNVIFSIGNLEEEIIKYIRRHKDIIFTIVSKKDIKNLIERYNQLNCPLVIISSKSHSI
ncbi:MAG: hypothetical protein KIIPBIDF_01380 [Candidatus Methanoperedenaceae archaeon GB50]|nr:hypothetical protein BLFGPEAP_02152 [Candidatus Methanoperedenaceae archaeon GB50]CAD7780724.1 MAG: hypothetical protein KIIPBIDF_01380 [Candidatus Methanoperedenaceae archaeon GB50]